MADPPLPPPGPGTRKIPSPSSKDSARLSSTAKLNYRAWLWLQHHTDSEFAPLARFILSGGPENCWVGKQLKSSAIAFEISQMYASGQGRPALKGGMVRLANQAVDAYRNDDRTIEDLMTQREAEDKAAEKFLLNLEMEVLETELGLDLKAATSAYGAEWTEGALARVNCGYINARGRGCTRYAVPGVDRCDLHGGRYMDADEVKSLMMAGQEKIVAASGAAIEAVIDMMQNSVQDAIRLKAAEMLLDRAGFRPGMDITITDGGTDGGGPKTGAEILRERIDRLAPKPAEVVEDRPGKIIREDGSEVA